MALDLLSLLKCASCDPVPRLELSAPATERRLWKQKIEEAPPHAECSLCVQDSTSGGIAEEKLGFSRRLSCNVLPAGNRALSTRKVPGHSARERRSSRKCA